MRKTRRKRIRKRSVILFLCASILLCSAVVGAGIYVWKMLDKNAIKIHEDFVGMDAVTLEDYTVYGTELLLNYQLGKDTLYDDISGAGVPTYTNAKYILQDSETMESIAQFDISPINAFGISFQSVRDGTYILVKEEDGNRLKVVAQQVNELSFYTVRIAESAKRIDVFFTEKHTQIDVKTVSSVSFTDADIVLDPGHGDVRGSEQAGACVDEEISSYWDGPCEREIMLQISNYVKQRFETHGLVVALTRDSPNSFNDPKGDYYNANIPREDYEHSKADSIAKTTGVLTSGAKLSLSLHFDSKPPEDEIYDVYQSLFIPTYDIVDTIDFAGPQIFREMEQIHDVARLEQRDYCFEFQEEDIDPTCIWGEQDFYFLIREYGGAFTGGMYYDNDLVYANQLVAPEALLIELFNGKNEEELPLIEEELLAPRNDGRIETIIRSVVEYYGIEYLPVLPV